MVLLNLVFFELALTAALAALVIFWGAAFAIFWGAAFAVFCGAGLAVLPDG